MASIMFTLLLGATDFTSVLLTNAKSNSNDSINVSGIASNGETQYDGSSLSNTTLAGNNTNAFMLENCMLLIIDNPYFILQPGYHTVFTGVEDNEPLNMTITVINQTKVVGDGIVTRISTKK